MGGERKEGSKRVRRKGRGKWGKERGKRVCQQNLQLYYIQIFIFYQMNNRSCHTTTTNDDASKTQTLRGVASRRI